MSLQGRTLAIRGSVDCVEDVLIEGRIDGHIWNEHHVVTIGADAVVNGDIVARQITVRGAVEGTLMATGRVDIMDEARVAGRVLSQKLTLAEGASSTAKRSRNIWKRRSRSRVTGGRKRPPPRRPNHPRNLVAPAQILQHISQAFVGVAQVHDDFLRVADDFARQRRVPRGDVRPRHVERRSHARKSSDAFPTASLSASSDISTVGAVFSAMPAWTINNHAA